MTEEWLGHLLSHISRSNIGFRCPRNRSVAEFAIDVARNKKIDMLANTELINLSVFNLMGDTNLAENHAHSRSISKIVKDRAAYHSSIVQEMYLLAKRNFVLWNIRIPLLFAKVVCGVLIALLFATMFNDPPGLEDGCVTEYRDTLETGETFRSRFSRKVTQIRNGSAMIFVYVVWIALTSQVPSILIFPTEFNVISNELANNWYRRISYFVAKTVSDIPGQIIHTLACFVPAYTLTYQIPVLWRAASLYLVILLGQIIGESIGMLYALLFLGDPFKAIAMCVFFLVPTLVFAGFLIPIWKLPHVWQVLSLISYGRHAFGASMVLLYGFDRCPGDGQVRDLFSEVVLANSPPAVVARTLKAYGVNESNLSESAESIAMLFGTRPNDTEFLLHSTLRYFDQYFNSTQSVQQSSTSLPERVTAPSYILQHFQFHDTAFQNGVIFLLAMYAVVKVCMFAVFCYKTRTSK